ncbi:ClpXP protease specificity-enhancing factor SspB [Wolbachia endosymbiont of Chironomus riparius]|uniref:ClpXP protease specificity-enhancing factor SspB n=1 Tax=Wolbachia endosymbiont of Chironomus riparius TaxID=2883238 RepID=UPI0020A21CCA|nr:ClpXP protease specificity-enhancing factor SspB [Wolbachia endosymbiont of Chironomus riparius]
MADDKTIDYKKRLNQIKFQIIKETLSVLSSKMFTPYLEVLFFTNFKGVSISEYLKKLYPDQMLIVLQYQFDNLKVCEDHFSVILSFRGKQEQITIPFSAIHKFHDKTSGDILIFDKIPECKSTTKPSNGSIISIDQLRET